ncbi:histidine phosphatase superfamily [Scleroderma yunnanense]
MNPQCPVYPVAIHIAPPIPGLFVLPVFLTRQPKDEISTQCMRLYFEDRDVNLMVPFECTMSGADDDADNTDARMGKGLPSFSLHSFTICSRYSDPAFHRDYIQDSYAFGFSPSTTISVVHIWSAASDDGSRDEEATLRMMESQGYQGNRGCVRALRGYTRLVHCHAWYFNASNFMQYFRQSSGTLYKTIQSLPSPWTRFKASIQQLNVDTLDPVQYKVFFLGRHGEGYHNVALPKHGRQARQPAWDDYWSKLNGDGVLTWGPDPVLTPRGEGQVDEVHAEWQKEHRFGIPLPDKLYCSPLTRAIQTNERTFSGLLPGDRKTNIRELLGIHTCDKRRTRSYIQETFPEYVIEEGFAEEDQLWNPDIRETCNDIDVRAKEVLDMIFECDTEHFISITAHGGFIKAFLRVTGHLEWSLPPGVSGNSSGTFLPADGNIKDHQSYRSWHRPMTEPRQDLDRYRIHKNLGG